MRVRWLFSSAFFTRQRRLSARVSCPCTVWACATRWRPSAVFGPDPRPPWNWHFCVLLAFNAGRPHCSLVRFDIAVHRAHWLLLPATLRRSAMDCMAMTPRCQPIPTGASLRLRSTGAVKKETIHTQTRVKFKNRGRACQMHET